MKTLFEILAGSGAITQSQRTQAEKDIAAGINDEEVLSGLGIDHEVLAKARAELSGTVYQDLREVEIPREVVSIVPRHVAEANGAIAYEIKGNELWIGLTDPTNFQAVQALDFLAQSQGKTARFASISSDSFVAALDRYEVLESEVARSLELAKTKFEEAEKAPILKEGEKIEEVVKGAPVSQMVATIMRYAVDQGASDIHVEPHGKETRVRYRIDGVLRTVLTLPTYVHSAIVSRVKVLSNLKLDETRIPQDGRITQTFDGKTIDFRVSTLPVVDNEKVVMRILDTSVGIPTLEQLGFRAEHVEFIGKQIKLPHGLLLISGPTGSGKSTTLYTALNMLNSEGLNIVTLEDPVEYYVKGVNQSQTRPEIGYTFASGLRSLLRQDPNVIMVGEIRDKETAELAVHAGLTGHLIFSTIHTNDALGVVPRLIDLGVEPFLLAATLNAAVAQRLARRLCPNCKEPQEIAEKSRAGIIEEIKRIPARYLGGRFDLSAPVFWNARGCSECKGGRYVGRVAIAEIIVMTLEMQRIIAAGFNPKEVREELQKQEALSLRQDAILKALEGMTTLEEVFRVSEENPMV
jgi:type IV pilus assembly protein PilB